MTTTKKTYTFKFTTRETYLDYRAGWKAGCAELSKEIRDLKRIRAQGGDVAREQSKLHYLAIEATEMLAELKEAKLEAGRQRAASRATLVAA